ncbi:MULTISPECIES: SMI1/KNR4 family protein [Rhodococcus]|uniref:SMI1/KNR4 family protein n=1 Tax=Rhodococcus TaxID=1827 RepID=UPI0029540361|nr:MULTISPECIES: SMI1/KNR4 family protein [Rhodococcus]MDV7246251.1 SMI1/KNR4 family protein [Rhodococcus oxybenzonivorans]MDV7337277.1 SMI1/KNR4 family protein [Rhodococcus oxybenzonivorans]MDV8030735.1 SMI1/KNR4 family protein [Rhodococcus sp. IEGM 27]
MQHLRTTFTLLAVLAVAGACSQSPSTTDAGETDWWSTAIETLKHEQKAEYERQKNKGNDYAWMLTTPEPPATDADITAAEGRLGTKFDKQFKDWLHHVNGWQFYCGADTLFPLSDVSKDSPKAKALRIWLDNADLTPTDVGVDSFDDLIVIGGAEGAFYIATVRSDQSREVAPVYEFGGGVLTHTSFKDFIQANIDLAKDQVNNPW